MFSVLIRTPAAAPRRSTLIGCAAALALAAALACDRGPPQRAPSLVSRIELAAGNVAFQGPEGKWQPASSGLLLRHGARVRTGAGDRALIRMDDGSAVFLRQDTEVLLDRSALRLERGELWVDAPVREGEPSPYRAGAVAVSASAAGFDLRRSGEQVEVYVARGFAVVDARGGRSEVQAGERLSVVPGQAPKIKPVAFWEDWTGGMADRAPGGLGGAAAGRIYAIDRSAPGSAPRELEVRYQRVAVMIRDGVARTTVEQSFFNAGATPVEGYYWFTVPEGAAVDRFALEVNGTLIEGEVIERDQAARHYEQAVRASRDPALLEWVDARTFRARVFPIATMGERRVLLSYIELLPTIDRTVRYLYPMAGLPRVQEFALDVDLGEEGRDLKVATTTDARIEGRGAKVTMRRSGFRPQGDFLLELVQAKVAPLRAARVASSRGEADYVMLRYAPDLDWNAVKAPDGDVVVVVDTSASGDDAERQLRADIAEAVLRALSAGDHFALIAVDLTPRVVYPPQGLAQANDGEVGRALDRLAAVVRGGATDLGAVLDVALQRLHGKAQPAVVYVGDGRPTVGELDGEALAERVTRSIAGSSARLFTIAAGPGSDHALLERLARIGGGRAFRVDLPQQAVQEGLRFVGGLKTPTITDLVIDAGAGLDQVFLSTAGKVSRGEEVVLLARTHHPLPATMRVSGKLGGVPFEARSYPVAPEQGARAAYVPKLWARRYLAQLLGTDRVQNRGTIVRLGVDYSLMTPFSSFLVLESEAAYQEQGIQRKPRDPLWGVVPQAAIEVIAAAPLALFGCDGDRPSASTTTVSAAPGGGLRVLSARAPEQRGLAVGGLRVQSAAKAVASERSAAMVGLGTPSAPSPALGSSDRYASGPAGAPPALKDGLRLGRRGSSGRAAESEANAAQADQEAATLAASAAVEQRDYCSDASRRPLYFRLELWRQRLEAAGDVYGWVAVYREASARCELPHQRDRRALLELLQERVSSASDATVLLAALEPAARVVVQRQLLRRAIAADFAAAIGGGEAAEWAQAEATLAQGSGWQERISALRRLCGERPNALGCVERLIVTLRQAGQPRQALIEAERVRALGLANPRILQQQGDLLVELGRGEEARRVYSELVEFAPSDAQARQLLGDIFLRHGWHEDAFRQYQTLVDRRRDDPTTLLRLAAAAAGSGHVDQALRLERQVAGGEGEPGPEDPRRWARLWSALRLGRLLLASAGSKASALQGMQRSLQRLQVLPAGGALVLLSWQDYDATLALELGAGSRGRVAVEAIDAGRTGLYALALPSLTEDALPLELKGLRLPPDRQVRARLTLLRWDGTRLRGTQQEVILQASADPQAPPVVRELVLPLS
ncbi:MAG: VWA domain-containing protein [Proteobacteria bacterium]|nr:VWA domain-containing protein [Pseudomonadota bacterium]